jgi:hypothetical protein
MGQASWSDACQVSAAASPLQRAMQRAMQHQRGRGRAACQRMPTAGVASICHGGGRACNERHGGNARPPNLALGKRILLVVVRGRRGVRDWPCALLCRVQSAERRRLIGAGRCTYVCRGDEPLTLKWPWRLSQSPSPDSQAPSPQAQVETWHGSRRWGGPGTQTASPLGCVGCTW